MFLIKKSGENNKPTSKQTPKVTGVTLKKSDFIKAKAPKEKIEVSPWLNAKDTWRNRTQQASAGKLWLMILCTVSVIISLACTAIAVHNSSKSIYVPYVVAVDSHGVAIASGFAKQVTTVDDKVAMATVSQFISAIRTVSPDNLYLINNLKWASAHVASTSPARETLSAWYNGSMEEKRVQERAMDGEIVNVKVTSVLKRSEKTYQVRWEERTYNANGAEISPVKFMLADFLLDYGVVPPSSDIEKVMFNPLGIYIKSFHWTEEKH